MNLLKNNNLLKNSKNDIDREFLALIGPEGNVSTRDERFIKTGDGYIVAHRIHKYPHDVSDHWLKQIVSFEDVITTIDIYTEDKEKCIANINKSYKEQRSRFNETTDLSKEEEASRKMQELKMLLHEVSNLDDVLKNITIRQFYSDRTIEHIENKISETTKTLESKSYRSVCDLNETKNSYRSLTQSSSVQKNMQDKFVRHHGQPITSYALARGLPFQFSALRDPKGLMLGFTNTNGNVLFDQWQISQFRLSYNMFIAGNMGAGKSSLLKKLATMNFYIGNRIRAFDFMGDWTYLVNYLGGRIIYLDGTADKALNVLEVMRTPGIEGMVSNTTNMRNHINKCGVWLSQIAPHLSNEEILEFQTSLRRFYEYLGFYSKEEVVGLSPKSYPLLSEWIEWVNSSSQLDDNLCLEKVIKNITGLIEQYPEMLNQYTSIQGISQTQFVVMNLVGLKNMAPNILDAQFYLALTLYIDDATYVGARMKQAYDNKTIDFDNIVRTLIMIDEAHRIVNSSKPKTVEQVLSFVREDRHIFAGMALASQSLRDINRKNATAYASELLTTLFELIQYKIVMQQDANSLDMIRSSFGAQLNETILSNIPTYEKGQCALIISPQETIEFKIYLSSLELDIYRGGA